MYTHRYGLGLICPSQLSGAERATKQSNGLATSHTHWTVGPDATRLCSYVPPTQHLDGSTNRAPSQLHTNNPGDGVLPMPLGSTVSLDIEHTFEVVGLHLTPPIEGKPPELILTVRPERVK